VVITIRLKSSIEAMLLIYFVAIVMLASKQSFSSAVKSPLN